MSQSVPSHDAHRTAESAQDSTVEPPTVVLASLDNPADEVPELLVESSPANPSPNLQHAQWIAPADLSPVPESNNRRPWLSLIGEMIRLAMIPVLIIGSFAAGIALLGLAQRNEWIASSSGGVESSAASAVDDNTSWICPMMCVPPTNQPGRCPVCAMELVPASTSGSGPSSTITVDPRARRVAGIETTVALSRKLTRTISSVGEIRFDETRQKTLAAYIDGRIEELKADYTGIEVQQGELLGRLYSPDLYSAQVEYLKTKQFNQRNSNSNERVRDSNQRLLESARQRLIELGMTEAQVQKLDQENVASRVVDLYAPISGTVIEKMATVGQYIDAGTPVYRLADLKQVWLVLELFPEDAQAVKVGQSVTATTQSLLDQTFSGTVTFIQPTVDPKKRTVGVRVAIDNQDGLLKPGEFAQAQLNVPLTTQDGEPTKTVVIPRNCLLTVGKTSLAYVELQPGEFQLRKVKPGPSADGWVAILDGIEAGEDVVSRSTFLLDAQMQLQGNPSLIDPDKAVVESADTELTDAEKKEIRESMAPLSESDRQLAKAQVICPVTEVRLGSHGMGTPVKLQIEGRTVFICCEGCRDSWVNNPDKYFKILDDYLSGESQSSSSADGSPSMETDGSLPQMELPQMELPTDDRPAQELPQMELPQMEVPR